MTDAVITGYSLVSPLGNTPEEFSRRMFAGESGVRGVNSLGVDAEFPVGAAGFIEGLPLPPLRDGLYRLESEIVLDHLLNDFLRQYGAWAPVDAVIFGTNDGGYRFHDVYKFHRRLDQLDPEGLNTEHGINFLMNRLVPHGQRDLPAGDKVSCSNACASGLVALGYARQRIASGEAERVLVICNEPRVRAEDLMRFVSLGAISRDKGDPAKASRPFTKSRSGFVKGEGAGMILLESRTAAEKRNAKVLAAVKSCAQTSDAFRLTDGREDALGVIRAMQLALERAGLRADQIDVVSAHGTSTYKNDLLETVALKKVFGEHAARVPVSALKSQIGHLNHACSLVETIAAVMMLENQRFAPTINQDDPDPECDLDYVPNESRPAKINYLMKNSTGFGGINASLILGAEKS